MTSHSGISIIVCTWNRSDSLRRTLLSLNEQIDCASLDVEVIVVDNNSSDDTKECVEDSRRIWKLGELRYAFEPRQGKQFALNHGIRVSRAEVLAFTDDDIFFPTDWVACISRTFQDQTLDLAGGRTLLIWPECGRPHWFAPSMSAVLAGVDLGERQLRPAPTEYAPAGSNLIARRDLFERVGVFSEFHFRHMDYEFGLRCARAQVNIAYEPSLIVYAPVAKACLTKRYFRRWSFKAGIARENTQPSSAETFLFAPKWLYRQVIEDCAFLLFRSYFDSASIRFASELRIWRSLGTIASRWYAKCRPKHYLKWVEQYSQKKKDLY